MKWVKNAIFYVVKTGCRWAQLPSDFPPYHGVHPYYRFISAKGFWDRILGKLTVLSRAHVEKKGPPTYSLIDSQSLKTTVASHEGGIDGGKKVKGRKRRHIVTDTQGHLLSVKVHEANSQDTIGVGAVFASAVGAYPFLLGVCADVGYRKTFVQWVTEELRKRVNISPRIQPR